MEEAPQVNGALSGCSDQSGKGWIRKQGSQTQEWGYRAKSEAEEEERGRGLSWVAGG